MSSGTPVIGYRHGGVTEMVVDGVTGMLADVKDTKDLEHKIDEMIETKNYFEMGMASRKRILANFSEDRFVANFSSMYRTL